MQVEWCKMTETKVRSLLKALSWRFLATLTTFFVAFFLTGEIVIALEIGFLDMAIKIFLYFIHERVWARLNIGRKIHPLADIKLKRDIAQEDKEIIMKKLKDLGYLD